jgi:hypothetical protein
MKKEVTMYKLAIVGIVLSGVLMSAAIAEAKPVGMSKAEDRALVIRSEGLNQKYGVGQKSQQAIIREKLGEIGAWAVPSTSTTSTQQAIIREKLGEIGAWAVPSTSTTSTQHAIIREKLGEIGAWAVPSTSTTSRPTPVVSSDDGFDWNNAEIGAAFVLGAMLLGVASLATRRRHHRPVAH